MVKQSLRTKVNAVMYLGAIGNSTQYDSRNPTWDEPMATRGLNGSQPVQGAVKHQQLPEQAAVIGLPCNMFVRDAG